MFHMMKNHEIKLHFDGFYAFRAYSIFIQVMGVVGCIIAIWLIH